MIGHSHEGAPTQFATANGIRFAYRRFSKGGSVPLVCFQYFSGSIDDWDPAVTNSFAADREVILFDNTGVGSSGGETPVINIRDDSRLRWVSKSSRIGRD